LALTTETVRALAVEDLEYLRGQISGRVLVAGDEGYDQARSVWNGMIDRSPTVIVQAEGTADVVAAVLFAGEQGLPVAVRGGGHNVAGLAVCDLGLMVDLSRMRRVEVDPARQIARAQGGALWGDFDAATAAHGLATTGGAISTTGIAGLTLGGGLGHLMRSYGLTCDNLLSAEVVTAHGEVLTASATENADLFWGIRGGGGNLGVVTEFTYRLHPVSQVYGGIITFPLSLARDLMVQYRDVTGTAPDALGSGFLLSPLPDGTHAAVFMACYNGPADEGARVVQPVRGLGTPLMDAIQPLPYTTIQTLFDAGSPSGMLNYWRSNFLTGLTDAVIDIVVDHYRDAPPGAQVLLEHLGGAVQRVGRDDTAFNHRDYVYNLSIIARWADPEQSAAHIAWVRGLSDAVRPHTQGVYVNYLALEEQADRIRAAYGEEKYTRLVELKDRYDPTNRFCFNQNIPPSVGSRQ
jgi:FAD/FMN-containing dehydrogenase